MRAIKTVEIVKFYIVHVSTFQLMIPPSKTEYNTNYNNNNNNHNKNRKTMRIAVLPMASALIAAAILVSGLSLISNHGYHSAIAQQQNTTEGNGGGAGSGSGGGSDVSITDSNSGAAGGDSAQGGNVTTTEGAAGTNLSTSELRTNLEQARAALQNNDIPTAMMYLDLTLNAIGGGGAEGNITSSSAAAAGSGGEVGNTATSVDEELVVSMGGTGAADDYDATADE